jgi:hypothetical protein
MALALSPPHPAEVRPAGQDRPRLGAAAPIHQREGGVGRVQAYDELAELEFGPSSNGSWS